MLKEDAKKRIEDILKQMTCEDILFAESSEDIIIVKFNCKELTSFVSNIPAWKYAGIQLDPLNDRQFAIEFQKQVS